MSLKEIKSEFIEAGRDPKKAEKMAKEVIAIMSLFEDKKGKEDEDNIEEDDEDEKKKQ